MAAHHTNIVVIRLIESNTRKSYFIIIQSEAIIIEIHSTMIYQKSNRKYENETSAMYCWL